MEKDSIHTTKTRKLEFVAKILGLLEEKGKNKDWLLEELRHCNEKLRVSPTVNTSEILQTSSVKALEKITNRLKSDIFEIKEIHEKTKTFHWFFTDIIGSSDPRIQTTSQIRKITFLQNQIKNTPIFKNINLKSSVFLPTGDGMAIGFSDSPETPLLLAVQLHELLNKYNKTRSMHDKIHIRIGLDTGPVYLIKDLLGNETVWGPGIIMARRMMDLCGTDQIFASRRLGDDISRLSPQYKAIMHPIGDYVIKHGEQLLVYNIYGKNFGNKFAPKKGKLVEKSKTNTDIKFQFNKIELKLDVTDPKTMMTHHTWIWDVKNITKDPLEQVYYSIGGDVAKDFGELDVKIRDENGNKLDIISLDVNKDYEKKFNVKLKNPIRRKQTGRLLILEYDWEEPSRIFEYVFSASCKKFSIIFTIPNTVPIKTKILEVDTTLGVKRRAVTPPIMSYTKNKTMIKWESAEKHTIQRHDAYEFQW